MPGGARDDFTQPEVGRPDLCQNEPVTQRGKRVGQRRQRAFQPALLVLALGVTLCVVAWGYLVKAAIDFGTQARGGQGEAWYLLGVASLGAVACLFVGLMLVARITRRLGITSAPRAPAVPAERSHDDTVTIATIEPALPARVGGRRAAR